MIRAAPRDAKPGSPRVCDRKTPTAGKAGKAKATKMKREKYLCPDALAVSISLSTNTGRQRIQELAILYPLIDWLYDLVFECHALIHVSPGPILVLTI
jgi:hypothetical protein